MLTEFDLTGQVAIVTGGARGIGAEIVSILKEVGATPVIFDLLEQEAADTAQKLGVDYVLVDVSKYDSVKTAVDTVLAKHGRVDILVNNAGITRDKLFGKMTPELWQKVIDVNLTGAYNMCFALWPTMSTQKYGRIVNMSSVVALMGNVGQSNYCAAKAGLLGLTKDLAKEGASPKVNILVNAVCPGFIDTPMTQAMRPEAKEAIKALIPVNRIGEPRHIALAVLSLVANDYITGAALNVNGGLYL